MIFSIINEIIIETKEEIFLKKNIIKYLIGFQYHFTFSGEVN